MFYTIYIFFYTPNIPHNSTHASLILLQHPSLPNTHYQCLFKSITHTHKPINMDFVHFPYRSHSMRLNESVEIAAAFFDWPLTPRIAIRTLFNIVKQSLVLM